MNCGVNIDNIDRAHRLGPKLTPGGGSPKKQQILVRFTSFQEQWRWQNLMSSWILCLLIGIVIWQEE